MKQKSWAKLLFIDVLIVIILITLDQYVKKLTDIFLVPLGTSVPIWEGVLHLTSVHNTGAAFGILSNNYGFLISIRIIACIIILFILIRYLKEWKFPLRLSLFLVLSGAFGNLIDQVRFGYVRDMFEFRFINFAVFNLADTYITIGAILMAIILVFFEDKVIKNPKKTEDNLKDDIIE